MAFVLVFTAVFVWVVYRITQTGRNQIIFNYPKEGEDQ